MTKVEPGSRSSGVVFLAKGVLAVALVFPIVFAILYPARKKEADAYAQAPICAPGVMDSASCRLLTDAAIVNVDCPKRSSNADDACKIELQVTGLQRFITFNRERAETLTPGGHLRVELFKSLPTGGEFNGQFMVRRGTPEEAMRTLRMALGVWTVLGLIAALYLWKRKK